MKKKLITTLVLLALFAFAESQNVLFVRGGDESGGWLEFPQFSRTEQLADINNFTTNQNNHSWGEFAATLRNNGYTVSQIKEGSGGSSPVNFIGLNLSQYDIIVLGSNNAPYNNAQVNAIDNWVKNGGGLLTISDTNFGSSWCDAPNSDQSFLDRYGIIVHQDRGFYTLSRNNGDYLIPNHPILNGVNNFEGEGVSPFKFANTIPAGVTVQRIVRAKDNVRLNNGPCTGPIRNVNSGDAVLVTATAGNGRVVGTFDRNTFFNRNGAGSNINKFDNKRYMLNIFAWLANTNGGNENPSGGTPDVDCNTLPSTLVSSTSIAVSVAYTSDQNREVFIELWNGNQYLQNGKVSVSAGSGVASVTLNLNSAPAPGNNYLIKANIRPIGTDWTQSLDACNKTNVVVTNGTGDPTDPTTPTNGQLITDGNYYINSPVLEQRLVSLAIVGNVKMANKSGNNNQKWNFKHLGDNQYEIKNVGTGGFLEVPQAKCGDFENVATWRFSTQNHHRWNVSANGNNFALKPSHCTSTAIDRQAGASNANAILYSFSANNGNQKWNIVSTGIQRLNTSIKETISIFPNPVKSVLNIINAKKKQDILIYDMYGVKRLKTTTSKLNNEVNVSSLPKGLYFMATNGNKRVKFIKN